MNYSLAIQQLHAIFGKSSFLNLIMADYFITSAEMASQNMNNILNMLNNE